MKRGPTTRTILEKLNGPWHAQASLIFLAIVLGHWGEHIVQAIQVFVLGWPRELSRGVLGQMFPWLVTSEWLHYWLAIIMLVGLAILRPAYTGRSRAWWDAALVIQVWHHFEHALLLGQALTGKNLFGSKVPISILQLVVPRVELHLFYNGIVFVPMMVAMYYHIFPDTREMPACTCARLGMLWSHAHEPG